MAEILHIYTRVSGDSQEENTSLDLQKETGMELAKKIGLTPRVWNEGVSSSRFETLESRPVISQLLAECAEGNVKHLYAEYTDRLSRNQATWSTIRITLRRNKILLYTGKNTDPINLQDPMDDLLLGILSEVSIFDNRIRAKRTIRGRSKRISENYWLGGPPPFGYRLEDHSLVADEYESGVVRNIFNHYIAHKSIDGIRDMLMQNGVRTRRGNAVWSHGSIDKLLKNTHYSGQYTVRIKDTGEVFHPTCPKLVPDEVYGKVHELRKLRSLGVRLKQPNVKYPLLLRDLLVCEHCGLSLAGKFFSDPRKNYYYCPIKERNFHTKNTESFKTHSTRSMKVSVTDDVVWHTVLSVLEQSRLFKENEKMAVLSDNSREKTDDEILSAGYQKRKILREIGKVDTAIASLNALYVLAEDNERSSTLATLDILKSKISDLKYDASEIDKKIEGLLSQNEWRDWVLEFKNKVNELRNEKDQETMRRFLDGVVDEIKVAIEENAHRLTICFRLPYVGDQLIWNDPKKKSMGYELVGGVSETTVFLDTKKKVEE
jgi:DNA invertase Pin-like site-specific DNA recombinase